MRIGMLTGGGDCPGLNAVIRAVVRKGEGVYGHKLVGFRHGWRGVVEGETMRAHDRRRPAGSSTAGGTILGTSRTNPYKTDDGVARGARHARSASGIDALIAIGGEDTLGVAHELGDEGVARRRRAEDDRQRPRRPPTSPSASTPRCRSPPTPSTACTPPPRATTG